MFFILGVAIFCSISITVAASRCTWAFARDGAIPGHKWWAKVDSNQTPVNALALLTIIQMLLGLINFGSTAAFTAFASVGTIALAVAYAIPVVASMLQGRRAISTAKFGWPAAVGWTVNIVTVLWTAFQLILFSMPAALPVTLLTMNWASVVFVGFMTISVIYYVLIARRCMSRFLHYKHSANCGQPIKDLPSQMDCEPGDLNGSPSAITQRQGIHLVLCYRNDNQSHHLQYHCLLDFETPVEALDPSCSSTIVRQCLVPVSDNWAVPLHGRQQMIIQHLVISRI